MKPLSDRFLIELYQQLHPAGTQALAAVRFARAVEKAHGITKDTTPIIPNHEVNSNE